MTENIELLDFQEPQELVGALMCTGRHWLPDPRKWVFRGHWDATWELLPSINRRSRVQRYAAVGVGSEYFEPDFKLEMRLLRDFITAVDDAGFEVPNASFLLDPQSQHQGLNPVHPEYRAISALAQHHEVPTRLLDWTPYALSAAYFAASGIVGSEKCDGHLEVWALRLPASEPQSGYVMGFNDVDDRNYVQVVRVPRATSRNQHAQGGLFTFVAHAAVQDEYHRQQWIQENKPPVTVDEVARRANAAHHHGAPLMVRLRLPQHRAGELLAQLATIPVDGSRMFPGFDGVARLLRERNCYPGTPEAKN